VHLIGVLIRQLAQTCRFSAANRLAKGGSHRHADVPPVRCTLCLLRKPTGGRNLDCRTVVASRPVTAPRPAQEAAAEPDRRFSGQPFPSTREVARTAVSQLRSINPSRLPHCRDDLIFVHRHPFWPAVATDSSYPPTQDQQHGLSSLHRGSKGLLNGPSKRLTRRADGEPT
jgi:hypothetical protein